jgi:CO/xanthine dehydrogenase Mo-binding subunit
MLKGKVGENVPNVDALEKVLGEACFAADFQIDDFFHLKVLRSDHPHARIKQIHTENAAQMPGIVRIFTHRDIPGINRIGVINKDQTVLAEDKVRFVGDPIAVVAAISEKEAKQALEAITIDYEDLSPIFDPEESLNSTTLIHETGNLLSQSQVIKGDVIQGFEEADIIIERTYQTSMVEHNYLEPDAGAAWIDEEGRVAIFASTQSPHYDHRQIVDSLGVDPDRVRCIHPATGGGFGGKLDITVQCFLALAAYHLQHPVRLKYSRKETYLATAKRHPLIMKYKTGAMQDGRLVAIEVEIIGDTGAYGSYGLAVASRSAVHATGPYQVPHVKVISKVVYTNNPFCGAMRGFGVPQVAFAHESQMDILAEKLGIDPFEIRLLNAFDTGTETSTGQILNKSVGIKECIRQVRNQIETTTKLEPEAGKLLGTGVGVMWYGIGNTGVKNPSTARAELDHTGQFTIFTGAVDIGQGSNTVLQQIAASEMGVNLNTVALVEGDTAFTPDAGATSASRQTYITGNAVRMATLQLKKQILKTASRFMNIPANKLTIDDGQIKSLKTGEDLASLEEVAMEACQEGLPLVTEGYFDPPTTSLDPETGQGSPYATYAFACQMAEVQIDPETGEVDVLRVIAAHDVGKAVNPENVKGQIMGGVTMGVGFALKEEFKPGQTLKMAEYIIPTVLEAPFVIPIIIEDPEPTGPYGAKGVGEPALIPTAPAILNAIAQALGERIYHLPANYERVFEAARKSSQKSERNFKRS